MKIDVGVHNKFDVVVTNTKTGQVQKATAKNIILNGFWGYFLSSSAMYALSSIHYGSGTVEPVATDTTLTSYIGGKMAGPDSVDSSTFYTDGIIKQKKSIRLELGEATGAVISEVGFSRNDGNSNLVTKALLKDANGNPLSITVGANDVVDIFATFFVKIPMGFVNGNDGIILTPNSPILNHMTCVNNLSASVGFCTGGLPPFSFSPYGPGAKAYYGGAVSISYDIPNKKTVFTISDLTTTIGNTLGGLRQ